MLLLLTMLNTGKFFTLSFSLLQMSPLVSTFFSKILNTLSYTLLSSIPPPIYLKSTQCCPWLTTSFFFIIVVALYSSVYACV